LIKVDQQFLNPMADMELDKNFFLHLLDMANLNGFFLLTSRGAKTTCKNFWIALKQNLIENSGNLLHPCCPTGRPAIVEEKVTWLKVNFSN
jgi:hypothetical protein